MMIAGVIHQTPPHMIMGYTFGELASLVTIVGLLFSGIVWIFKLAIIKPMMNSNELLSKSIDELAKKVVNIGDNADKVHAEHDARLDEHEVHLARHDEEIKTLFNRTEDKQKWKFRIT